MGRNIDWWRPRGSAVGLVVVAVVAGMLFANSARLFASGERESPDDVAGLVREYSGQLEELENEVAELREERELIIAGASGEIADPDRDLMIAVAGVPVSGPGVRVRLWDAPHMPTDSDIDANDLVIHQQDIEAVVNALWAGGAEALTIQGQRLSALSAVRCVGNVLLLHGRQYSPPYTIEAIGDPTELVESLYASPEIAVYLEWVEVVGLGWELTEKSHIEMPAYDGPQSVAFAEIDEGAM